MKIDDLFPKIDETEEFNYLKIKSIPNIFGCYVLSNFENEILYIGKTVNLQSRFLQHLENPEKMVLTKFGKAYWFSYKQCKDSYEISKLERGWLNHFELNESELPLMNKIHAG